MKLVNRLTTASLCLVTMLGFVAMPYAALATEPGCIGNHKPVPVISPERIQVVPVGHQVYFSAAHSYDPDHQDLKFLWAANQLGLQQNGLRFHFAPPEAGTYVVTLVAGDRCGAWDVTWTVIRAVDPHDRLRDYR